MPHGTFADFLTNDRALGPSGIGKKQSRCLAEKLADFIDIHQSRSELLGSHPAFNVNFDFSECVHDLKMKLTDLPLLAKQGFMGDEFEWQKSNGRLTASQKRKASHRSPAKPAGINA